MRKILIIILFVLTAFLYSTNLIFAQGTFECNCVPDQFGGCASFEAISVKCDTGYTPNPNTCTLNATIKPCVQTSSTRQVAWGEKCDPSATSTDKCTTNTFCRRGADNTYRCLYLDGSRSLNNTCQDTTECTGYNNAGLSRCGVPAGGGSSICQTTAAGGELCTDTPNAQCKGSCGANEHVASKAIDCKGSTSICCAPNTPSTSVTKKCPGGADGIDTAIGCIPISDTNSLISFILRWALGIAGGIAFLLILVAGFQITTSRGDPNRLKAGQELLTSAIAGLVLLIFSVVILRIIGFNILNITFFK